jgi:hypothetical protein
LFFQSSPRKGTRDDKFLTIEFQDQTSLYLNLQPSLTIQFQREGKDDLETLAEWPPIRTAR